LGTSPLNSLQFVTSAVLQKEKRKNNKKEKGSFSPYALSIEDGGIAGFGGDRFHEVMWVGCLLGRSSSDQD